MNRRMLANGRRRLRGANTRRPHFEALEARRLLAVFLENDVNWVDQGARPIVQAQLTVPPDDDAGGAVQSIAVNPSNPSNLIVGTVNGGVWETDNANPAAPGAVTWTPRTDQFGSLAIGAVAFSPLDSDTIYAGTGLFSNGFEGGPPVGLLRSDDGGVTWAHLAESDFTNRRIKNLIPTNIDLDPGPGVQQVVLAGTINGNGITGSRNYSIQGGALLRSTDSGNSFTQVAIAPGSTGAITGLISDPNDNMRFYAGVPGGGVFRSDDAGVTWNPVNTGIAGIAASDVIELAAHDAGATTVLYAALADDDDVTGVFRSTDNGANWTALAAVPAAFRAGERFAEKINLAADPVANDIVYISGQGDTANILRYDPSGGGSWVNITEGGTAGNTDPHADSRDLVFLDNTTLLQSDDGGIYFIQNPTNAAANDWQSFVGDMGAVEFYSTAYDNLNNVIFGGSQDNGSEVQNSPSNTVWTRFLGGDGQTSQAARSGGNIVRYSMSNNLQTGNFIRSVFDNTNTQVGATANVQLADAATPGVALSGLNATDAAFTGFFFFPYEVNATDSNRLLLGSRLTGGGLYESANMGDVIADVTPAGMGPVTSVAYGATNNADAAYVTDANGDVWVRTTAAGAFTRTNFDATPDTGDPLDVVMDPNDFNIVYVVDANGVFQSTDAGDNWTDITDNLGLLNAPLNLRSVALVQDTPAPGDGVLLVGGQGGVYRRLPGFGLPGPAAWTELGSNMPNTIAEDLRYDATDDLLVAGTFGRGAWTVPNAVDVVDQATVLNICGDEDHANQDDLITLARRAANPLILDVTINGVFQLGVPIAMLSQINVFGQGGDDNLVVDSSEGLINVPHGVRYDGDGACPSGPAPPGLTSGFDTLTLSQVDGPSLTSEALAVGATVGAGVSTIVAEPGNLQTVEFVNLEPVVTNVPAPTFTVNDGVVGSLLNESNAINYTASSLFGPAWGEITIDAFEPIHFANKTVLTVDAAAGSDQISLNNSATPAALTGITIQGGDPTAGSDTAIISGTTGDDAIIFAPTTEDDATVTGAGPVPITLATIEHAVIDAQGGSGDTLTYRTPAGEDSIYFTPGAEFSSGSIVAQHDETPHGPLMPLAFTNLANVSAGALLFDDESDEPEDDLFVAGTDSDESFDVSAAGEVTVRAVGNFSLIMPQISTESGVDHLTLLGLSGVDRFTVAGNHPFDDAVGSGAGLVVEGGDSDGDSLAVRGEDGADDDFRVNPGLSLGSVEVNVTATVYTGVEHLLVFGNATDTDTLRINDFFEDNQWTVRQSTLLFDLVQIDQREPIEYAFFDSVTLFNSGGTDTFRVYPTNLNGFTTDLRIRASAGGRDDVVELIGTEGVDTVTSDSDTIALNGVAVTMLDNGAGLARVTVATLGGDDEIDLDLNLPGVLKRVEAGDGDDDVNLAGTMDADIFGGPGDDTIVGSPLADRIYGGTGNDTIEGGEGNDTIYGEAGNDRLQGDAGNDFLFGGDDDDLFRWSVGDGNDANIGGQGIDELLFSGDGTDESFTLFQNDDSVAVLNRNGASSSTLTTVEDVFIFGRDGADTFEVRDLYASDLRTVHLDLGFDDGAADEATVHGRDLADDLLITAFAGAASAFVKGLRYDVIVSGETATEGDTLRVHGNEGDDSIKAADGVEDFIGIILHGDAGDDFLSADAILNGGTGNDVLVGGAGNDTLNGDAGEDLLIGGGGVDTFNGGPDFDTIQISGTSGNDTIDVLQGAPSAVVGGNYTFTSTINGGPAVQEFITTTNAALAPNDPANRPTVEQIRILAGDGNDAIRVTHADQFVDNNLAAAVGAQMVRFDVDGGGPTASDNLVVRDDGLGDLVLVRQGVDERSGRITVAPARNALYGEVVYRGVENVDITPLNGVTGGTGTDGNGRVVVFQPDVFEMNDNRLISTQITDLQTTNRNPTIDPGQGGFVPADEDWYEFRPTKVGTFRFEVLYDTIGALPNARPGLPGDGNLTISVYNGAGQLIVHGRPNATGDGVAAAFSVADAGNEYFLRVQGGTEALPNPAAINTYQASVVEVDLLGPQVYDPDGPGPNQAIQVVTRNPGTGILEPNATFNLFEVKPMQGPTPVVDALLINVRDLLAADLLRRAPGNPSTEVYAAVAETAANPALYSVVGDADGTMAIASVDLINAPTVNAGTVAAAPAPTTTQFTAAGLATNPTVGDVVVFTSGPASGQVRTISGFNPVTNRVTLANALVNAPAAADTFDVLTIATATIQLNFTDPLPDDRFTLTISDAVRDPAHNLFDGESDFAQPVGVPTPPSGDGVSGGDFVARFTVDTRPEVATTAGGSIYADINDNMVWDPDNPDFTNRDITFVMGFTADDVFAGNFVEDPAATADGFDKLAVFGPYGGVMRWLIDFDNDGAYDLNRTDPLATANNINGTPIAGDWDGNPDNGDEVGVFTGTTFYFDTNHDFRLDAASAISGNMRGLAAAGDIDGDGADDLITWRDDRFYIDLANAGPGDTLDGNVDVEFFFGFIGAREMPLVADMNADGYDDIGLWVPDREGQPAREAAEWYFLVSTDIGGDPAPESVIDRIRPTDHGPAIDFTPKPFAEDIYMQFGDDFAVPVVGNFDPPINEGPNTPPSGGDLNFNPKNIYDVNNDGAVTTRDLLSLVSDQVRNGSRRLASPATTNQFVDVNRDGYATHRDIAAWMQFVTLRDRGDGEAEGEAALAPGVEFDQRTLTLDADLVDEVVGTPSGSDELSPLTRMAQLAKASWESPSSTTAAREALEDLLTLLAGKETNRD